MKTLEAFRAGFPLVIERAVKWGEMDAFQHLNNTAYFRFFEDVRIAHFEMIGALSLMDADGVGPILAQTEARFRAPLRYPDTVLIGSRISDLESDRFVMNYGLWSRSLDCLAAEGSGRIVYMDYGHGRKCPIPESIRKCIG